MDNLGIFKLLNMFYDLYSKTKNNSTAEKDFNIKDEKAQAEKPQKDSNAELKPVAPLQNAMLLTMNKHDEFVKRVMNNNLDKK